jgi:hypothetical protein
MRRLPPVRQAELPALAPPTRPGFSPAIPLTEFNLLNRSLHLFICPDVVSRSMEQVQVVKQSTIKESCTSP